MTIISGVLKDRQGTVLAQATLTLTEIDSKQTVITTTDNDGHYYIQLSPGTWCVTLGRGDAPPKDAGVIAITKDTAPGALDDYIASLQPSTLDIQVLGFMRGLVSETERASEALNAGLTGIGQIVEAAKEAAAQALAARDEAHRIVGDGRPGRDGHSAYEIWVSQQPAGSDTSMAAYMAYQKGTPGAPGKDGLNGLPGKDGRDGKDGAPGKSPGEYRGVHNDEHYLRNMGTEEGTWLMRSGGFGDAPPGNRSEDALLSNIYAPGAVNGDKGLQIFMSPTALNFREIIKGDASSATAGEWCRMPDYSPTDGADYTLAVLDANNINLNNDIEGVWLIREGTWRVTGSVPAPTSMSGSQGNNYLCLLMRIR
ncbi:prophage tail fiber N-terminal domain-containing protein [Salmonella enterica]|nr:prophage tail fiber N-terminal domain-containing protein [Salmonella enterica]HEC8458426.1 prophage tail fiber N-terminal domain-containing protein [Salmonella enterica subsp. enterica serovar Poona]